MPYKILGIKDPDVSEVFGLVGGVLETTKEDDVVFPVRHAMAATGWGCLPFGFDLGPLAGGWFETPEIRVVVEGALLGRGELAPKEVYVAGV